MPIRMRLAALYTAILAACLLAFVGWFYNSTARHLLAEVDSTLWSWAQQTAQRLQSAPDALLDTSTVPRADAFSLPGLHVQILDKQGAVLYCSENLAGQQLPYHLPALRVAQSGQPTYFTVTENGSGVRILNLPVKDPTGQVVRIVQVGKSLQHIALARKAMRNSAATGITLCLLLMAIASYFATSRALKPVAVLTSTARSIAAAREFSHRVPGANTRDELGKLATAFNEMLASLENTYEAHRRFLADASHQLRTPLTSLRTNISFLQRAKDAGATEKGAALADMAADTERMSRSVQQLLYLARTDNGQEHAMEDVNLTELAAQEIVSFRTLAGQRRLHLEAAADLVVRGDREALRQALRALLENAVHYTPPGGEITVGLVRRGGDIILHVADNGIGIDPAEQADVFERFYRSTTARQVDPDGAGLGLSIVKRVAELHKARLHLFSAPGAGSRFEIAFPA